MGHLDEALNIAGLPPKASATAPVSPRWSTESTIQVRHWSPKLLSFSVTRPAAFRFTPGHYARIGLTKPDGDIVWRPLSMVSSARADHLEFVVVLVPGGEFSALVADIASGATVHVDKSSFGFLTVDQLAAGDDLWLLASGTGIGPFVSILRDESAGRAFSRITLLHSVRQAEELVYKDFLTELAENLPGFSYIPVVTRPPFGGLFAERIPALIAQGTLELALGLTLDCERSRVMVCGNPELARDLRALLSARGFQPGRRGVPGQMAFEKYW